MRGSGARHLGFGITCNSIVGLTASSPENGRLCDAISTEPDAQENARRQEITTIARAKD